MTYEEYMRSHLWKTLPARMEALQRDGMRCRGCNGTDALEMHHRHYPVVLGTETAEDLTTLCKSCHEAITVVIRHRRYMKEGKIYATVLEGTHPRSRPTPHEQWAHSESIGPICESTEKNFPEAEQNRRRF